MTHTWQYIIVSTEHLKPDVSVPSPCSVLPSQLPAFPIQQATLGHSEPVGSCWAQPPRVRASPAFGQGGRGAPCPLPFPLLTQYNISEWVKHQKWHWNTSRANENSKSHPTGGDGASSTAMLLFSLSTATRARTVIFLEPTVGSLLGQNDLLARWLGPGAGLLGAVTCRVLPSSHFTAGFETNN